MIQSVFKDTFKIKADSSSKIVGDKVIVSVLYRVLDFPILHDKFEIANNDFEKFIVKNGEFVDIFFVVYPNGQYEFEIIGRRRGYTVAFLKGNVSIDAHTLTPATITSVRGEDSWVSDFISPILNTVQRIIRTSSVSKHLSNFISYEKKIANVKRVRRKVSLTLDEFTEIADEYELFNDARSLASKDYDVVVDLDVIAFDQDVMDKASETDWPGSTSNSVHNYFLLLTNEQFEDFERRLTEINAKNQARKLSKAAERLT